MATTSIAQMKAIIMKQYPRWFGILKMPDRQVIAIYYNIIRRNKT